VAGEVMPSYARLVASQTRTLSVEAAAYVDARVAESVDGRIPWGRFEALVAAAITAADPAAAKAREEATRKARYAYKGLSSEGGMGVFTIRSSAFGIAKIDATVDHVARILKDLGSTEPEDDRRATAAELLADPAAVVKLLAAYAGWRDRPADDEDDALAIASDRGGRDENERTILGDENSDPEGDANSIIDGAIELWGKAGDTTIDGTKPVIDWSRLLPTLTIFVHVYAGRTTQTPAGVTVVGADRDTAPDLARIEGLGTVTEGWLRPLQPPPAPEDPPHPGPRHRRPGTR
jgi:hypothetical protein